MLTTVDSWDPNNGAIARSSDQGATWSFTNLTFKVGGNMPGRGSKHPFFYSFFQYRLPSRSTHYTLPTRLIKAFTDINS